MCKMVMALKKLIFLVGLAHYNKATEGLCKKAFQFLAPEFLDTVSHVSIPLFLTTGLPGFSTL